MAGAEESRKLSTWDAARLIRQRVRDVPDLGFSRHARQRMDERDVAISEVLTVLRGCAVLEVTGDPRAWRCVAQGRAAGRPITVVVILDEEVETEPLAIVTLWPLEARS